MDTEPGGGAKLGKVGLPRWTEPTVPPKTCRWARREAKHPRGTCSLFPNLFFQLGGGVGLGVPKVGLVGVPSHTCRLLPPPSFLWKKWKDLCVGGPGSSAQRRHCPGELVSAGPELPAAGGGLPSCWSSSDPCPHPSPQCCFLPPTPPSPPRQTCSCWPARSPAACATWRRPTLMGEAPVITGGLGAWEPARPSPVATEGGSPNPLGYLGHSSWEHV